MAAQYLALDSFWVDRSNYSEAEQKFYERLGHEMLTPLVAEFVKARETIKEMKRQANEAADVLGDGLPVKANKNDKSGDSAKPKKAEHVKEQSQPKETAHAKKATPPPQTPPQTHQKVETTPEGVVKRQETVASAKIDKVDADTSQLMVGCNITAMDCEPVKFLEKKMLGFTDMMAKIQSQLEAMDARLSSIEQRMGGVPQIAVCPAKPPAACAKPVAKPVADDDDDVDLFGSDSEDDDAAAKVKEERLAAYNAKKSKKPALIAKSSIILDIKPWDDETDMKKMEEVVRQITCDGLLWGASKLVPLAYGIKKLQMCLVVEDDKVSIDWLQEQIEANEDYVQSVDIAAFNKI